MLTHLSKNPGYCAKKGHFWPEAGKKWAKIDVCQVPLNHHGEFVNYSFLDTYKVALIEGKMGFLKGARVGACGLGEVSTTASQGFTIPEREK